MDRPFAPSKGGRKHPMSDNGRASEVCLGGEYTSERASVLVRRRTKTRPPPSPHHAAAKRNWRRWRWRGRPDSLNGRETDSIADSLEVTLARHRSSILVSPVSPLPPSLLATLASWPRAHGRSFSKTRLTQPSPFHSGREGIHLPLCVCAHRR